MIFEYGQTEINYLKQQDSRLGEAIDQLGLIKRAVTPDLFAALVRSIASQQISTKAANTVWGRLCEMLTDITPANVSAADLPDLQQCGISLRKAGYIKSAADSILHGELDLDFICKCPDDEVVRRLSSLHGVGIWTAEMLLIFSLRRPDVVSWGDLAIHRGMMNLYGLSELDRDQFEQYRSRYSPYGSVASLYLWAISAQ